MIRGGSLEEQFLIKEVEKSMSYEKTEDTVVKLKSVVKNRLSLVIYLLFFTITAYLAYQLPYCHDDWHWGLSDRVVLMKNLFQNYNGRYLGNITILLITRSILAKTLIPAFWMTWLLREMEISVSNRGRISEKRLGRSYTFINDKKHCFLLLIIIFLLAALPQTLLVQSYGWFAAFANFVPPAVLFLCWFNQTDDIYIGVRSDEVDLTGVGFNFKKAIAIFMLALCTQFFAENITIFVVLYVLWIIVYSTVRKGKLYFSHLIYFIGAITGAILMFTNGGYHGGVSFKSVSLSIADMYYQLRDKIMDHLFINNVVLNITFAVVIVCLLIRKEKYSCSKIQGDGRKHSLWDALIALSVWGYACYCVWHSIFPDWKFISDEGKNNFVELLFSGLFFISVLIAIWRTVDSSRRTSFCILYLCSILSAAPLMAANPIGARCFYFNYALQCLTVLKLIGFLLEGEKISIWYPTLLISAALAVLGGTYLFAFTANGATERARRLLIEEAVESKAEEVILPYMSCPSWCYVSEPMNEEWLKYYKDFYGIPEEMTVTFQ